MRPTAPLARILAAWLLAAAACGAVAATVNVVGLFPGKALVSIDGGAPRTLAVGQRTPEGVTLVSVGGEAAVFDIDGRRHTLRMGEAWRAAAPAAGSGAETLVLAPDSTGHYATVGAVNGRAVRFFVDTGASMVWLSAELAQRLGVDYQRGRPMSVTTAGGVRSAWAVRLASVRVGNITLTDVEGAVGEGQGTGDTALLGMSFLGRLSLTREGDRLRLAPREATRAGTDSRPSVTLSESRNGMFATNAQINGVALPFLVDTGATSVAIDMGMAERIGLNYQKGTPMLAHTAAGQVRAWRVKLDTVTVGAITLYNVDGTVLEGPGAGIGLLGMSFLSRLDMRRDGGALVLIKRF